MKKPVVSFMVALSGYVLTMLLSANVAAIDDLNSKEKLGKQLFFDARLSQPAGQSCASCHSPQSGFADPHGAVVSEGVHKGRFTSRNAPTIAYIGFTPTFYFDEKEQLYVGGFFHDGRAKTLKAQLDGPLFNKLEMANKDKSSLISRLKEYNYTAAFRKIYGDKALSDVNTAYQQLVDVFVAYEKSRELSPFSSKYDAYLAGKVKLTTQELRGLKVYEAEDKGNCAACHPSKMEDNKAPLFTDFTYDNLGVPKNTKNPFYKVARHFNPDGEKFIDQGLGKTVKDVSRNGKFKVPTLRNIALTAPYMHNGVFATLEEVVSFYNSRDVDKKWAKAEVSENVNKEELGDLKLSKQEEEDLVVFLKTLNDGYKLKK